MVIAWTWSYCSEEATLKSSDVRQAGFVYFNQPKIKIKLNFNQVFKSCKALTVFFLLL